MKGRARIPKDRSKGALALAHCGHSTEQICRATGYSDVMVNYLISGEKKPSILKRKLLAELYGIPEPSWDEPITSRFGERARTLPFSDRARLVNFPLDSDDPLAGIRLKNVPEGTHVPLPEGSYEVVNTVPIESLTTSSKDVRDAAGQLVEQAKDFMRRVNEDKVLTFTEKARVLREASAALDRAGRLTGESSEIPVSKILKSPAWARIGKIIADAIAAEEDKSVAARVMRRVGEALKGAE